MAIFRVLVARFVQPGQLRQGGRSQGAEPLDVVLRDHLGHPLAQIGRSGEAGKSQQEEKPDGTETPGASWRPPD